MFEIREVRDGADFAICMAIRREVFVNEQGVPIEEEMDWHDEHATHFLATFEGRPVACARARPLEGGAAKIERVAVLRGLRGNGLGFKLMSHVVAALRRRADVAAIVIHAQVNAVPFYEKMDFVTEGDLFMEADIPHYRMRLAD